MRKKLLALLMCATMVLGTGVTAFADDTQDTVNKITNKDLNPKKFISKEVSANGVNGTIKDQVSFSYLDGTNTLSTTVTVCYDADNNYTPVVMYEDDNGDLQPATLVSDVKEVTEVANQSVTATAIANAAATGKHAVTVKLNSGAKVTYLVADGVATETKLIDGTNYVETKASINKLTANDKILSDTAISLGKVLAKVDYVSTSDANEMQQALYEGVKSNKISSNAFAVKFTTYVQENGDYRSAVIPGINAKDNEAVKAYKIYDDFNNFMGGTFSLDYDLFTNSTLKKANGISVYKFTGYTSEYSDLFKEPVKGLIELGTSEIGGKVTFENVNSLSGVFVFDEGTVANNDSASDEQTTTANNAGVADSASSSPKTGDVAPIAALAVVMMGACGAMVVASKKRA